MGISGVVGAEEKERGVSIFFSSQLTTGGGGGSHTHTDQHKNMSRIDSILEVLPNEILCQIFEHLTVMWRTVCCSVPKMAPPSAGDAYKTCFVLFCT